MRVTRGIVLIAWLLGSVAAPCVGPAVCARSAQHECCCGDGDECCCRLTSGDVPAIPSGVSAVPTPTEIRGLPDSEPVSVLDALVTCLSTDWRAGEVSATPSSPIYLDLRTLRC